MCVDCLCACASSVCLVSHWMLRSCVCVCMCLCESLECVYMCLGSCVCVFWLTLVLEWITATKIKYSSFTFSNQGHVIQSNTFNGSTLRRDSSGPSNQLVRLARLDCTIGFGFGPNKRLLRLTRFDGLKTELDEKTWPNMLFDLHCLFLQIIYIYTEYSYSVHIF